MTRTHRVGAALAIAASLIALAACGSPAPKPSASPTQQAPVATATPEPAVTEPAEPAAAPECDTILPAATVADFASLGWEPVSEDFRVGANVLSGGIQCKWGDPSGGGRDHGQLFGWAPIDSAAAERSQAALISEGWVREDSPDGVYITEDPSIAMAPDEDGYGMTYLFGDGWVELADTKQGLLLVEWAG